MKRIALVLLILAASPAQAACPKGYTANGDLCTYRFPNYPPRPFARLFVLLGAFMDGRP